jgi:hypothetical protein
MHNNELSDTESEGSIILIEDNDSNLDTVSNTDMNTETDVNTSIESEYEIESEDDEDELDEIYQDDSDHYYAEKEDGYYYIGTAFVLNKNAIIMLNTVSPRVMFKYPFHRIQNYLGKYDNIRVQQPNVHIMKLCILEDNTYSVIMKTYWLRIVQRSWKKVYKERKWVIRERCFLRNILYKQITGKYPCRLNLIPTIHGMI